MAAASGLAKTSRRLFSKMSATISTGMVPTTSSQAMRASSSSMRRSRSDRKNPLITRTQSWRNTTSRARAVATCSPTTKVRKNELGSVWALARALHPGINPGSSTEWPRLEMGNSSVTPCSAPITMAWT